MLQTASSPPGESLLITARERHFGQLRLVNERSRLFSFLQKPPREHFGVGFFKSTEEGGGGGNKSPCVYIVDRAKITKRSNRGKAFQDRRSRHLSYLSKFFFVASPSRDPPLVFFFFFLSPLPPSLTHSLSPSLLLVRVSPSTATRATSLSAAAVPIWHLPSAHVQKTSTDIFKPTPSWTFLVR